MPGSNAVAAKAAIVARLQAAPALTGVQVAYAWPGKRVERECIFGTKIRWDDEYLAFAKAAGRMPRLETATITFVVFVVDSSHDFEAADRRAVELGTVLEELVAGDPRLSDTTLATAISSGDLEALEDDGAAVAQLTYEISVRSELT